MNTLTKPKNVKIAIGLFIVSIIIGVIYSLIFNPQAELQEHLAELQKQLGESLPNGASANAEKVGALGGEIGGYLGSILSLVLIYLIYLGKNWARIVMLVFTIISLIAFPFSEMFIFKVNPEMGIISGITYLLNLIAVILLFTPSSNHWFKHRNDEVLS